DQVTAEQRVEEGLQVGRRGGHLARGPVEGDVLVGDVDGRAVVQGGRGADRRGGQSGVVGEGGAGQVERVEDAAPDDGVVRPARDRLDEAAGHDVVGVRVAEVGAGREVRVVAKGLGEELVGRVRGEAGVTAPAVGGPAVTLHVVVQPAGVVEHLAHGDGVAAGHDAGEVPLDGCVEVDAALVDELEDRGRDEGLRDAAD